MALNITYEEQVVAFLFFRPFSRVFLENSFSKFFHNLRPIFNEFRFVLFCSQSLSFGARALSVTFLTFVYLGSIWHFCGLFGYFCGETLNTLNISVLENIRIQISA